MSLQTVESSLGAPISTLFDSFDTEPVASASIAQVHRAVLNGKEVAVKVQKSAIPQQVRRMPWIDMRDCLMTENSSNGICSLIECFFGWGKSSLGCPLHL